MASTYTGGIVVGQQFGRLTAVELAERRKRSRGGYRAYWRAVCQCGQECVVESENLRRGRQQSCGCLRAEVVKVSSITHGLSKTPIYAIWNAMNGRCSLPSVAGFANYGGRGIKVCERWQTFENFYADMGDPPFKGASIDRIDNDGDYEPGNVRWAGRASQARNKRWSRLITYLGETKHMLDWCDEFDISYSAMKNATHQEPDLTVALHRRVLQKLFDIPLKDTRHLTTADLPRGSGQTLH